MLSPEPGSSKVNDIDTRSTFSMQELEPSPVDDSASDIESGEHVSKSIEQLGGMDGSFISKLGLRAHKWDPWFAALQKYSTYPPTLFIALHFFNTSLIPLATRSVASSDNYLLLTRPIYQSPGLEHVVLTVPVLAHIASGIVLRNIRASRRARLYGAEPRDQSSLFRFWPRTSLQVRLGYALVPFLGTHTLVTRITPLIVDGGSSGVGLGYVAHTFARSPLFWNIYYLLFVAVGVWHIVGGWAAWMGWGVTTSRREHCNKGSLAEYLGSPKSVQRVRRQRKMWWMVNGIAALGASVWLAGALGIIGRAGEGSGWEAKGWNEIYNRVPVIGKWL